MNSFRTILIFIVASLGCLVNASAQCLDTVTIIGYSDPAVGVDYVALIPLTIAQLSPQLPPTPASGPGGKYSAKPNQHTNCTNTALAAALDKGAQSSVSTPLNTALTIPMRYQNPIDISNNSPIGLQYGGTNGSAGFMVFPNLAKGTNAAIASIGNYAQNGYSVYGVINAWAPVSVNPATLNNTLSGLGISQAVAQATALSSLTAAQLLQVISAFSWQEGFKPAGC